MSFSYPQSSPCRQHTTTAVHRVFFLGSRPKTHAGSQDLPRIKKCVVDVTIESYYVIDFNLESYIIAACHGRHLTESIVICRHRFLTHPTLRINTFLYVSLLAQYGSGLLTVAHMIAMTTFRLSSPCYSTRRLL